MLNFLLVLAVVVLAILVYRPVLRRAEADMAARSRAGLSNSVVYALLLFPLVGPFLYLLFRRRLTPEE